MARGRGVLFPRNRLCTELRSSDILRLHASRISRSIRSQMRNTLRTTPQRKINAIRDNYRSIKQFGDATRSRANLSRVRCISERNRRTQLSWLICRAVNFTTVNQRHVTVASLVVTRNPLLNSRSRIFRANNGLARENAIHRVNLLRSLARMYN